jgi:hypothetical protein
VSYCAFLILDWSHNQQRYLLADDAFAAKNIAGDLQETLLQDSAPTDKELLVTEMATLLCIELAYGTSSPWHDGGYVSLVFLSDFIRQAIIMLLAVSGNLWCIDGQLDRKSVQYASDIHYG